MIERGNSWVSGPLWELVGYDSEEAMQAEFDKKGWVPKLIPGPLYQEGYKWAEVSAEQEAEALAQVPTMDFYRAWHFLRNHPCQFDSEGEEHYDLWVWPALVNPETGSVDDDKSKNTQVEIWVEFGHWCEYPKDGSTPAFTGSSHDTRLDCGGKTYEEAIITLAQRVAVYYGTWDMSEFANSVAGY